MLIQIAGFNYSKPFLATLKAINSLTQLGYKITFIIAQTQKRPFNRPLEWK